MVREAKIEVKVNHGLEVFWKAVAKDYKILIQKIAPRFVKGAEVIVEGDGGVGTLILFNFGTDVPNNKEKIVELDESLHRITIQVVEGGHLNNGFSSYKTTLQLTSAGEDETLVHIMVTYETELEDKFISHKTTDSSVAFVKSLENYLSNPY